MMAGIRGANTKPEMALRQGLHAIGFRFRLHDRKLPGKPDLVLARYRAVIFANGCFWHGHDCHLFKMPSSRVEFWSAKIARNREVDLLVARQLEAAGWRIATVWECALKGRTRLPLEAVIVRLAEWLRSNDRLLLIRGSDETCDVASSRITSKASPSNG